MRLRSGVHSFVVVVFTVLSVGSFAFAETFVIQPGQTIPLNQYDKVYCAPSQPPVPAGPLCSLHGAGPYKGLGWNFRISIDNQTLDAKDSLDEALRVIRDYSANNLCASVEQGTCSLSGAGSYKGLSWNYLITINGEVVHAVDSQNDALSALSKLRAAHLCR